MNEENDEKEKSYFECKRCFHKFYNLHDIMRHINKKKLCIRAFESFKYNDDELEKLSLERVNKKKKDHVCEHCNKKYINIKTLKQHQETICRIDKHIKNEFECETESKMIGNNITIHNTIHNNININFGTVKDFNENWDISNIDEKLKFVLLLSNSKFTNTLENILDNEVNLNVLIDNTTENGLVYTNNMLQQMDEKDIMSKTMKKIYEQLEAFREDLRKPNKLDLQEHYLDHEMNNVKNKYADYRRVPEINNKVNNLIKNIYNNKQKETINELENTLKIIELKEGY